MRIMPLSHHGRRAWSMRRGCLPYPWEKSLVYAQRPLFPHGEEPGLCAETSLSLGYSLVYAQRPLFPKVIPGLYLPGMPPCVSLLYIPTPWFKAGLREKGEKDHQYCSKRVSKEGITVRMCLSSARLSLFYLRERDMRRREVSLFP